jgi:hypothetical protein
MPLEPVSRGRWLHQQLLDLIAIPVRLGVRRLEGSGLKAIV